MRLGDQMRTVRHTFASNRARALLTLLGIMIGTGSIVLLAGVLRAGEEALLSTSQRATEADLVTVRADEPPAKDLAKTRRRLGAGDATLLEDSSLLGDVPVASESIRDVTVERPVRKRVRIVGGTPQTQELYHLDLIKGRFLDADDVAERRHVCVVGHELWKVLLEEKDDPVGEVLHLDNQAWTVVGVLAHKPPLDGSTGFWTWDGRVVVPQTTYDSHYSPQHDAQRLFVRMKGAGSSGELGERMKDLQGLVRGTILRRHYGVENFKVEDDPNGQNTFALVLFIIKALLLGTGLLSLFVGGINIMNIMLVTVTERTREIGVRRAMGATPRQVLGQFLLEASVIAVTGGLIGVLGGVSLTWLIHVALEKLLGAWAMHVEVWSIALGLSLSLVTGIVFGMFPAWRAAQLDPVEALRYE